MFGGSHSLSMQSKQTRADLHGGTYAPIALQKSADRGLTTWNQVSQGLLGQSSRNQFRSHFLKVHTQLSRLCSSKSTPLCLETILHS